METISSNWFWDESANLLNLFEWWMNIKHSLNFEATGAKTQTQKDPIYWMGWSWWYWSLCQIQRLSHTLGHSQLPGTWPYALMWRHCRHPQTVRYTPTPRANIYVMFWKYRYICCISGCFKDMQLSLQSRICVYIYIYAESIYQKNKLSMSTLQLYTWDVSQNKTLYELSHTHVSKPTVFFSSWSPTLGRLLVKATRMTRNTKDWTARWEGCKFRDLR